MRDLKTKNPKPQNLDSRLANFQSFKSINKACKKSKKDRYNWGQEYAHNQKALKNSTLAQYWGWYSQA